MTDLIINQERMKNGNFFACCTLFTWLGRSYSWKGCGRQQGRTTPCSFSVHRLHRWARRGSVRGLRACWRKACFKCRAQDGAQYMGYIGAWWWRWRGEGAMLRASVHACKRARYAMHTRRRTGRGTCVTTHVVSIQQTPSWYGKMVPSGLPCVDRFAAWHVNSG